MAWEENSCICLNMQLIAILSRIGVFSTIYNKDFVLITPIQNYYSAKSIKQCLHQHASTRYINAKYN